MINFLTLIDYGNTAAALIQTILRECSSDLTMFLPSYC